MTKIYETENIRNIGLFGHRSCGKTSLAEAFLFNAGVTSRLGSVDGKTSVFDYLEEEQSRGFTISSIPGWVPWKECKVNILDTPGDLSFLSESRNFMGVIDLAVFVVSAHGGVEVGTEILWATANRLKLPRVVFVNKCERERTDPLAVLEEIQKTFEQSPVCALQLPIGKSPQFEGFVDLLAMKAYRFPTDGSGKMQEGDIPAAMANAVTEAREALLFKVAETDEELEMKMLEEGTLSEEELRRGLAIALKQGLIVPVLFGSATANVGISHLLDLVVDFGPNPMERAPVRAYDMDNHEILVEPSKEGPFAAVLFKTVLSRVGKFGIFRSFRGAVDGNSEAYNPQINDSGRLGNLIQIQGKDSVPIERAVAGDIVGIAKLKVSKTGDSLSDVHQKVRFDLIKRPEPLLSYALRCADEDKVVQGLHRLAEEDIAIIVDRDSNTAELLLRGQGQGHIDVVIERLRHQSHQEVELTLPKIAYRETIRGSAKYVEGKLKKQSGGRGQFGVCFIDMLPAEPGAGFVFEDAIVGGVIPRQYIPAVQKGIEESCRRGVLSGCQTIDFHVRLVDGKTHPVDSSEQAFKMAGSFAFREAVRQCKPILLEPYALLEVTIPADHQGDISGDLSRRRGRIEETTYRGRNVTIRAKVPEAEIQTYANQLTSMTEGRGIFHAQFSHYEQVPPAVQSQIVEQLKIVDEE